MPSVAGIACCNVWHIRHWKTRYWLKMNAKSKSWVLLYSVVFCCDCFDKGKFNCFRHREISCTRVCVTGLHGLHVFTQTLPKLLPTGEAHKKGKHPVNTRIRQHSADFGELNNSSSKLSKPWSSKCQRGWSERNKKLPGAEFCFEENFKETGSTWFK